MISVILLFIFNLNTVDTVDMMFIAPETCFVSSFCSGINEKLVYTQWIHVPHIPNSPRVGYRASGGGM